MNELTREIDVADAIVERLPDLLPNLKIRRIRREWRTSEGKRVDIAVQGQVGAAPFLLVVEVKAIGEPRMALAAVAQLRALTRGLKGAYPVFCAPFVPPSSRTLLKEEGVGYLDLVGNAYLRFANVLVDRSAPDPPARRRTGTKELLAPKTTRILRTLLNNPRSAFGVRELAEACRVSPAAVVLAVRLLEDKSIVERDDARRIVLTRPGELLDLWASAWSIERNAVARYFSISTSPQEIMDAISRLGRRDELPYGLTLHAGASLVTPFVRFDDVWLYAPGDIQPWIEGLDLAPAKAGANVFLLSPYDAGVLDGVREIKKCAVVSDTQLYVDLYNYPARGREQAQFLRERRLTFGRPPP